MWWPTLVVTLLLVALWLAPGLQGRPVILATALLLVTWTVAGFVAVQVGSNSADRQVYTYDETPFFSSPFSGLADTIGDALRAAAIAALVLGVLYLVGAALVDRLRLPGLGTPLIVAGVVSGAYGTNGVTDQRVVRAVIPLLFLALVIAVGVAGGRKATTWLGGVFSVGAAIALALALLGDNPSAGPAAALIALFGLLVLVGRGGGGHGPPDTLGADPARPCPPAPPWTPARRRQQPHRCGSTGVLASAGTAGVPAPGVLGSDHRLLTGAAGSAARRQTDRAPASTSSVEPVMKIERSLAQNSTTRATSSGTPARPSGSGGHRCPHVRARPPSSACELAPHARGVDHASGRCRARGCRAGRTRSPSPWSARRRRASRRRRR